MKVSFEQLPPDETSGAPKLNISFDTENHKANADYVFNLISPDSFLFEPIALSIKADHPEVFKRLRFLFKKSAPLIDAERVLSQDA